MSLFNSNTFRAFRNRNFALFFCGQSVSQIGTWMQRTAVNWLVYTITGSPFWLGVATFSQLFPSFLLSLYGGIISDRYSRHKILLVTQTASMVQAILLAVLTLTHHYVLWEILSLSVMLGIINAFDVPARQPMVHEMINNKEDLPNALAFNSSMVNIARLLGPALSGIVFQQFGAGICFLLNATSFVAVITSLLFMKLPPFVPPTEKKKAVSELADGISYMKKTPAISMVLFMLLLMSLFVLPYNTLLPVYAREIFKGNAATFGYINSFIGIGAVAGSMYLASLKPGTNMKRVLLINTIILGVSLLLFSQCTNFILAMCFAITGGFGTMSQTTVCITIVQMETTKSMRGRVMSYVAMAYFGMLPFGSLLIGAISQKTGAQLGMLCQGIMCLLIVAIFFRFLTKETFKKEDTGEIEEAEELVSEKV